MKTWLADLTALWRRRIAAAIRAKEDQFGSAAREMWRYLTATYEDLYVVGAETGDIAVYGGGPYYRPRINKFQEFVDLYMPFILGRNPVRRVSLRRPVFNEEVMSSAMIGMGMPVSYARHDRTARALYETAARLLEWWLQYCADEYDILREARLAVTEALVKGRGLLWHGLISTASGLMPASFYESVDNLFIDPAAVTLRDAGYIIRRRRMSSWLAAETLGIDENKLLQYARASLVEREAGSAGGIDERDTDSQVVEYYEVYSRIGSGVAMAESDSELRDWREALESLGPYQFYAIASGGEHPLNVDPERITTESELRAAVEWPVMTFGDTIHPWPVSILDFYPSTTNPWARSPLEPGLPMQVFLDHLYGYVMSQVRRSTRTIVVVPDHVDGRFVDALRNQDADYEVVPITSQQIGELSSSLYQIVEFPAIRSDLITVIQDVERVFNKAVGLDEVLYGATPDKQIRSAAEAQIRYTQASNRAMAMAETVEKWMSSVASKDGILSRLYVPFSQMATFFMEPILAGPDGEPVPGGPLTGVWSTAVTATDAFEAGSDFWFTIESGSGMRKDKAQEISTAQFIAQTLLPVAMQAAGKTGNFEMFNRILERLSNAMDADLGLFRMEPQPVGPPSAGGPPSGPGGPSESPQPPIPPMR